MRRGGRGAGGPGGAGGWGRLLLVEVLAASVLTVAVLAVPVLAVPVLLVPWASSAVADTGPWAWPLAGTPVLGREFAPPASRYGSGHRGVDLVGEPGGAVSAAGAGRVSYAGMLAGRGVVVVVHGDLRTTYEPVSPVVAVGDAVGAGEQVGVLEPSHAGCPSAACLHWGLRRGETYLDPVGLVERRPARLLPLESGPAAAFRTSGAPAGAGTTALRGGPVGVPPGAGRRQETAGQESAGETAIVPSDPVAREVAPAEPVGELEPVRLTGSGQTDVLAGLLAAAALIAGIALLTGRRPEPSGPAAAAAPARVASDDVEGPDQTLIVELATERLRRRSGS